MRREYGWRTGGGEGMPAQKLGEWLERVHAKRGLLTAAIVVQEAARKRSPAHDFIHGASDAEAAASWREDRARYLLRQISVRVINGEERPAVRAFVSVATDDGRGWVTAGEAREDESLREQVRQNLLARLSGMQRDLQAWDEFSSAAALIEQAHEELIAA